VDFQENRSIVQPYPLWFKSLARPGLSRLLDLFFPPACLVCGKAICESSQIQGPLAANPVLCADCAPWLRVLPPLERQTKKQQDKDCTTTIESAYCLQCGEPSLTLAFLSDKCVACTVFPPPFSCLRSVLIYRGNTKQVLKRFKYGKQRPLAACLGILLAQAAQGRLADVPPFLHTNWQLLVAVPSSLDALRARGFSHLGLVIRAMSRILELPADNLVLRSGGLRCAQAGLPLARRFRNVANAFYVAPKKVVGRKILLIDDVVTSGASLWSGAKALLDAGAESVDALTVARSSRFQVNRITAALHAAR
jgi:ComF family protein